MHVELDEHYISHGRITEIRKGILRIYPFGIIINLI
jgi:hypothetical protein